MNDPVHALPDDFDRLGDLLEESIRVLPPPADPGGPAGDGTRLVGPPRSRRTAAAPRGSGRDPARELALAWPDVVGEKVAANTRPVQLRQGRLVVSASSSAWAQTLQFMSTTIMARLNDRLGEGTVQQVAFRHAGWEQHPRGQPGEGSALGDGAVPNQEGALSADEQAALAGVKELGLAPELERRITRAMRAAFVRGQQEYVR
jgi:hypothetical protein